MEGAAATPAEIGIAPRLDPREVSRLLDRLFLWTGVDFERYARRAIERRLGHILLQDALGSVAALRERVVDAAAATRLADRICVTVTTLFRDPPLWRALRERVVPELRELPIVRVWSAGCATGEEAYALAILLREEGLGVRSRIYATDVDEGALARARDGVFAFDHVREYTRNYVAAGGRAALSEHYVARADGLAVKPALRRAVVFGRHNLATDASFNEFHLVLCRNVVIYFQPSLQRRVHGVVARSLAPGAVLGLGVREIVPAPWCDAYEELEPALKIYRRSG